MSQIDSIYTEEQMKELHTFVRASLSKIHEQLLNADYDAITILSVMNYYMERDREELEKHIADIITGNVEFEEDEVK